MAVAAHFNKLLESKAGSEGKPRTARRAVRLRVLTAEADSDVIIHNISSTGLLLETDAHLAIGDEIAVDVPEAAASKARVAWSSGRFFGCAFERPLSPAAVSAAQLRSEPIAEREPLPREAPADDRAVAEGFGARLRALRMSRGLTLVELARRMNVSRPTVWSWEAGRSTPRRSKSLPLQKALGVTEDELFGTSAPAHEPAPEVDMQGLRDGLRQSISEAKERIAAELGTSPDRVKVIIEV